MPRPIKCRRVAWIPGINYFKPAGIPLHMLEEVCLTVEEAEAIRLKDVQDLDQEGSARQMNISRPTFQRVLESARKKMADALLGGKAIRIMGGNFQMSEQRLQSTQGHELEAADINLSQESQSVDQEHNPGIVAPVIAVPLAGPDWLGGGRTRGRRRR